MKLKLAGFATVATGCALLIAGCGGSSSSSFRPDQLTTERFAGDYSGAFVAIGSESGADVSGIFSGTTDSSGRVTGTVLQDGGAPPVPASGTINNRGAINISANGSIPVTPPITFSTALNGTTVLSNGDSVFQGTLLVTQSNGNNPRGRFVGIRNAPGTTPYAGNYTGTFNGRISADNTTFQGSLALTVNANGVIRGTFARAGTNIRVRPIAGTIDRSGSAQIFALAEVEVPADSGNFSLVVNQLNGKGTTDNGGRITGTLNRTGDSSINATGTFTVTRAATAN